MQKEYCITYRKWERAGWFSGEHWVNHYFLVTNHQMKGAVKSFWKWAQEQDSRIVLLDVYVKYKKR